MAQGGILIVSASTGTGHRQAGEAIRSAMAIAHPQVHVEHVDLLTLGPSWIRTMYGGGYELMATRAPWLWDQVYRYTDGDRPDRSSWSSLARKLLFGEFRRLLNSRRWDHCICTHFLPAQLIAGQPNFPPISIAITDFTLHRIWVQRGVTRYFVATEALANVVRARLPTASVSATGIPISPDFADAPNRRQARFALRLLTDRKVVLVMGGGLGIGIGEMTREVLRGTRPDVQVVALCGRNEEVREDLIGLRLDPLRLAVQGFVTNVASYIAAADFVVTKPGGLTTSEALSLARPLVFTRAIPGQETGNAREVIRFGAGLIAQQPEEVSTAVRRLTEDESLLRGLSAGATRIGRPASAAKVAAELMEATRLTHQPDELGIAVGMAS